MSSRVAERDEIESDAALQPVVPHRLATIFHSQFCSIVASHWECLATAGWTPTLIEAMEQEHKDLARAIAHKPALRAAIDARKDEILFDAGWFVANRHFESLQRLIACIVTVILDTAQVESDFRSSRPKKATSEKPSQTFRLRVFLTLSSYPRQSLSRVRVSY